MVNPCRGQSEGRLLRIPTVYAVVAQPQHAQLLRRIRARLRYRLRRRAVAEPVPAEVDFSEAVCAPLVVGGCRLTSETKNVESTLLSKKVQAVESRALSTTRGQPDVFNLHLRLYRSDAQR